MTTTRSPVSLHDELEEARYVLAQLQTTPARWGYTGYMSEETLRQHLTRSKAIVARLEALAALETACAEQGAR
jgi:hypothetical protein